MEKLVLSQEEFTGLQEKIDEILKKLDSVLKTTNQDQWLTSNDVLEILKISRRTLQSYRDTGILPFSKVKSKFYYRASDIEEHLKRYYVRSKYYDGSVKK